MNIPRTSNVCTTGQMTWACFTHTIRFDYARGNQYQRTEHGSCAYCGKKYTRVIKWGLDRRDAQWWRAA